MPRLSLGKEPFNWNQGTMYEAYFKIKKSYFRKHRVGCRHAKATTCRSYSSLSPTTLLQNSSLFEGMSSERITHIGVHWWSRAVFGNGQKPRLNCLRVEWRDSEEHRGQLKQGDDAYIPLTQLTARLILTFILF